MRIVRVDEAIARGPYDRAAKALEKKLPNVRADVTAALAELIGDAAPPIPCPPRVAIIPGLGPNVTVLKIRVKSSDLTKGRSGGLRVLLQRVDADNWRPLFVYVKGEDEDVSRDAILDAIKAGG